MLMLSRRPQRTALPRFWGRTSFLRYCRLKKTHQKSKLFQIWFCAFQDKNVQFFPLWKRWKLELFTFLMMIPLGLISYLAKGQVPKQIDWVFREALLLLIALHFFFLTEMHYSDDAQCLKIARKVAFNIASEASYVYIYNKSSFKNAKNGPF